MTNVNVVPATHSDAALVAAMGRMDVDGTHAEGALRGDTESVQFVYEAILEGLYGFTRSVPLQDGVFASVEYSVHGGA
jgi:hypothetical protein